MNREEVLDTWLSQIFKDYRRVPLAGDASFRKYYRIFVNEAQYVVMDAPPPESIQQFMNISTVLDKQGLKVPVINHQNLENGFLVLSDFGDRLYLHELTEETADELYHNAFEALLTLQTIQADVPCFESGFIERQFNIFEDWYIEKHCNIKMTQDLNLELRSIYALLSDIIEIQPQVFVHRDYHSRNLMLLNSKNPGILDFQDAMIGPITYDLVSLLQDCYIAWPRERVNEWVKTYKLRAKAKGLIDHATDFDEFLKWFEWTGLQRHLKNLGIFARLSYRDAKPQYLKDMPRVLNYILETCRQYSELKPLQDFFQNVVLKDKTLCVQ